MHLEQIDQKDTFFVSLKPVKRVHYPSDSGKYLMLLIGLKQQKNGNKVLPKQWRLLEKLTVINIQHLQVVWEFYGEYT